MNKLHNAEVSLEVCRAVLSQHGQHNAAHNIRGLEVHSTDGARLAHGILCGTTVYGAVAEGAKNAALQALEEAMKTPGFLGDA